jgi:hypothetical protein
MCQFHRKVPHLRCLLLGAVQGWLQSYRTYGSKKNHKNDQNSYNQEAVKVRRTDIILANRQIPF